MMDVAREAGVSRAAVSKVIRDAYGVSPDMRKRVESAIERLGYRPSVAARAIRGSSFTIGFELHEIENPALSRILRGAAEGIEGTGYRLVIAPGDPEGQHAIDALVDLRVDGLVAIAPRATPAWLENLASRIPLVLVSRHDPSVNYDTVAGGDDEGARLVMRHLFDLGHRSIAHLTRSEEATAQEGGALAVRLGAYLDEMARNGRESRIQVLRTLSTSDAYHATVGLLDSADPPTALFASHDDLAFEVLRAVRERGLDASDLSVVGYDNVRFASHPGLSLTTVDQSGDDLGRRAVRLLLERINGRTAAKHEETELRLVVRGSTAPPRR
ncbi:LacI family transcriptional regulator [Streptomyces sp. K1PN6]|uniref:LacI family transcriptional regulator n=2 Tax=Streptomyces acidicola TaxID=2596892 RepID=A0A5N8WRI3_9ACTN|nr:LacI family transcriptional regulator [Streptomyces acidicola]